MIVVLEGLVGVEFVVKFVHINEGNESTKVSMLPNKIQEEATPLKRHTECKILERVEGKEDLGFISIGYAKCHPNDNFNKEIGRQQSLKKALEDGEFTKEAREQFWNAYRNWGKNRF